MYFPYLRGRQFELIALRELLDNNLIGQKIVPIIEPIKPTSTLAKTLNLYTEKHHAYALIMNPEVGEFVSKIKENHQEKNSVADEIYNNLTSDYLIKGYLMKKTTPAYLKNNQNLDQLMIVSPKRDCLDDYIKIYNEEEPLYSLIPDDRTFSRKAPTSKVLFMDRFPKAPKNSDYNKNVDEFFSEDHLFFNTEGFKGFSDYSIIGSDYNESGFAPLAVAIHIVYFGKNKELRVHHFVSDSNTDYKDPASKFGEAVSKLADWTKVNEPCHTLGLDMLLECKESGKYPGLGTIKKYSIMHHLELMNKYLEGEI